MQRGVDPGAAVRQPDGIGRERHPEGHRRQQQREPERDEVGDAPPPDEVVHASKAAVLALCVSASRVRIAALTIGRASGVPTGCAWGPRGAPPATLSACGTFSPSVCGGKTSNARRQRDRRVAVGAVGDAGDDALVDLHLAQQALRPAFSAGDLRIAQAERLRRDRIQPRGDLARLIAVVRGDAFAAVVDGPGAAGERDEAILDDLQRAQPRFLGFLHHPQQRDVAQALVRIAAADVRVHAGEPDLLQPALLAFRCLGRRCVLVHFVPQQRLERVALVVQRQRVPGALDPHVQAGSRACSAGRSSCRWRASSRRTDRRRRDGVPHADEADGRRRLSFACRLDILRRPATGSRRGPGGTALVGHAAGAAARRVRNSR